MNKAGPSLALLFLSVFIYGHFLLKDLICGSNSCLEPSAFSLACGVVAHSAKPQALSLLLMNLICEICVICGYELICGSNFCFEPVV
jgi:hypothetical protein